MSAFYDGGFGRSVPMLSVLGYERGGRCDGAPIPADGPKEPNRLTPLTFELFAAALREKYRAWGELQRATTTREAHGHDRPSAGRTAPRKA